MGVTKKVNSLLQPVEKKIQNHLVQMNVSCHRLILFDSILWVLFIIYYIGHFFYSKQFKQFQEEHKEYEKLVNEKDMIILVFFCLAALLYLHFFVLSKN
jgi:hypothetical protein|tara:strand:+ start:3592 stop:3888 length:297 start_codon:yes stop_codon:yes gene_type:complete